jgi:hypothetical protein
MGLSDYRFRERWTLAAPAETVYEVLVDLPSYPHWWPQVLSVEQLDDDSAHVVCRSALPYLLRFDALRGREDRDAGVLEARLVGDLLGWSRWTVAAAGAGTELLYEQQVSTPKTVLKRLALVARPLLLANHAWMMRGGRHGLEARLGQRSGQSRPR